MFFLLLVPIISIMLVGLVCYDQQHHWVPCTELEGYQLGELGRDVCYWLFCSAQAASRAEQGTDFAESFIRLSRAQWETSRSRARSAESSLSAMPSAGRRRSRAGVTSTIPTREFAKPLSMARSKGTPRPTSFSLNQTETPRDSSRSCSSLAAPCRSSHAWQRNTSRRSGSFASSSTLLRTGVSARTSSVVYQTDEPARDQRGFALRRVRPPLLCEGGVRRARVGPVAAVTPIAAIAPHRMQGSWLRRSMSDDPLLVLCI